MIVEEPEYNPPEYDRTLRNEVEGNIIRKERYDKRYEDKMGEYETFLKDMQDYNNEIHEAVENFIIWITPQGGTHKG